MLEFLEPGSLLFFWWGRVNSSPPKNKIYKYGNIYIRHFPKILFVLKNMYHSVCKMWNSTDVFERMGLFVGFVLQFRHCPGQIQGFSYSWNQKKWTSKKKLHLENPQMYFLKRSTFPLGNSHFWGHIQMFQTICSSPQSLIIFQPSNLSGHPSLKVNSCKSAL